MQLKTNCFSAPNRNFYLLPGFVFLPPKFSNHKHLVCEMKSDLFVFILTNFNSFIIALYKKILGIYRPVSIMKGHYFVV